MAALWASTTTKMAPAVPSRAVNWAQVTDGKPKFGSPLGTTPRVETPSAARSSCQLTMMAPTTAMSAPGMRGEMALEPRMTTMTATETHTVAALLSSRWASVATNFCTVPPDCLGTPNMSPTCPMATWMPTPVRKPTSTLRERKFAMKPSLSSRASTRKPPVMMATMPARLTYSGEAVAAIPARPAAMMAAVAESAPTTRCREEPSRAKTAIGMRIVYRPVMTGIPAIEV